MTSSLNKEKTVYVLTKRIPVGKVATYGQIAKLADISNPRQIGQILHLNPDETSIPCHRVVSSSGKLAKSFAFGGEKGHRERLVSEGVQVQDNKVDLEKFQWRPQRESIKIGL